MNPPGGAFAVLAAAVARGIKLAAEGERLRYRAPAGTMTDDLRTALAAQKPALLGLLASGHDAATDHRAHWRWVAANWPHGLWVLWRRRSAELQARLGRPPGRPDIDAADLQAFEDVIFGGVGADDVNSTCGPCPATSARSLPPAGDRIATSFPSTN
jgi:hypothetical protein